LRSLGLHSAGDGRIIQKYWRQGWFTRVFAVEVLRRGEWMNKPANAAFGKSQWGASRRKFLASAACALTWAAGEGQYAPASLRLPSELAAISAGGKKADHLCIFPIWESALDIPTTTDAEYRQQARKLKKQIGPGNQNTKIGFASIYSAGNLPLLLRQLKVFKQEGIHRGVILAVQTHDGGLTNPDGDLRNYEWRLDGKTWRGAPGRHNPRDWMVVTPSRYASAIVAEMKRKTRQWAADIKRAMAAYPGTIQIINFAIEEELAIGGMQADAWLADYSPFAVAEFRDWLRHQGLYAPGGPYVGQGAPEQIVGRFIRHKGHVVSPFFADPSPDLSHHDGPSFNRVFGTSFRTWALAYWDLELFPKPIYDPHFNPSPKSGFGATPGGFDAPSVRNHSRWWRAWDWTYQGNGNHYPPGNPYHPAFGFREFEVAHFVRDVAGRLVAEGLPRDMIYAHQIPAELLGDEKWGSRRALSSASNIWTGYLPANGHLGITRFGSLPTKFMTQYSHNWGIFEWHPLPNSPPESSKLYDAAMRDLKSFTAHGCRALFPGWWHADRVGKTFPLNDSALARAIKDFLALRNG